MKTKTLQRIGAEPHTEIRRHAECKVKHLHDSDDYWECVIRAMAITVYHPTSTCRMGAEDDVRAVVDPQLR